MVATAVQKKGRTKWWKNVKSGKQHHYEETLLFLGVSKVNALELYEEAFLRVLHGISNPLELKSQASQRT